MKNRVFAFALATSVICAPLAVQAQYVGPSTQVRANSVAEVLRSPVDDQKVVLKGRILKNVGKDKYIFSDGTGEIRVEIDQKRFPPERIDDKTVVEISGEIETEFMKSPEIEVDLLSILK